MIDEGDHTLRIRNYQPADLPHLRQICLATGHRGESAAELYQDSSLLADYYAAPYATLEPTFTLVLDDGTAPVGYIVGVPDTANFGVQCEREWFPKIRQRLTMPTPQDSSPDARLIRLIFAGHPQSNAYPDFPAHLHIDLLSSTRSCGWGRKLIESFLDRLRQASIGGVHLGVNPQNENAVGFYQHMGFRLLETKPHVCIYGMRL